MTPQAQKKRGWRGYITSRRHGEFLVPQRVQNLVIRTYAQSRGMHYLLSVTEYYMDSCHMMLKSLMDDKSELENIEGLIFYSLFLLPTDKSMRRRLYDVLLSNGAGLHFALEELSIRTVEDVQSIEDIMLTRDLSASNVIQSLSEMAAIKI